MTNVLTDEDAKQMGFAFGIEARVVRAIEAAVIKRLAAGVEQSIPSWKAQCSETTTLGAQLVLMQAEIDDLRAALQPQAAAEPHTFNDESPFCVKCGSTGECADEIHRLTELLAWAYSKLHDRTFNKLEDNLKLDEMKLFLEHGL